MSELFYLQLFCAFFLGGFLISLLAHLSEKSNKKIAGIVLTFPTTMAISFFFLGWTLSSQIVADIIPSTLIPLGFSFLFVAIYSHISFFLNKYFDQKICNILSSLFLSLSFWFLCTIPLIIYQINSLPIGLLGYAILIFVTHKSLGQKKITKPEPIQYTKAQKLSRAIFAGSIVFLVVLFGKVLGPFWGGLFAMFPAGYISLLTLFHWYYGPQSLFPLMEKAPLGSLSLLAYSLTVMIAFPLFGFIGGSLLAYLMSLFVSWFLIKLQTK